MQGVGDCLCNNSKQEEWQIIMVSGRDDKRVMLYEWLRENLYDKDE